MTATPYRHLDVNAMPVEELPSNPGKQRQLLWRDAASGAEVFMSYGPAGFAPRHAELLERDGAHRHYHNTVTERHYVLGGDYPVWHWSDLDADGTLTVLRRHTYLENPPRTLHGSRPQRRPTIATQMLVWNNGSGTGIFDEGADRETFEVPFDGSAARPDHAWESPRILATTDMPWQPHPHRKGWKLKHLAPAADGIPPVVLVNVPADAQAGDNAPALPGAERRWLYVLAGDLSLTATAAGGTDQLTLKEGHFLTWPETVRIAYPKGTISAGGCTALCVGHDLARSLS